MRAWEIWINEAVKDNCKSNPLFVYAELLLLGYYYVILLCIYFCVFSY